MNITIQSHLPVILGITTFLVIGIMLVGKKLKEFNPTDEPKGVVLVALWLVEIISGFVDEIVSYKYIDKLGPYILSIAIYILVSNYIGLLGFDNPTGNYSVTLTLALITWFIIQAADVKYSGFKGYIKSYFEPIFPFVIPNFFGAIAPLISMSLRLFGNIMSGTIIMSLVYTFTSYVSSIVIGWIPVIGQLNLIGPFLAAPLHAFFDLFSGGIQMFIFIMLTMVLTGNKIPDEEKIKS